MAKKPSAKSLASIDRKIDKLNKERNKLKVRFGRLQSSIAKLGYINSAMKLLSPLNSFIETARTLSDEARKLDNWRSSLKGRTGKSNKYDDLLDTIGGHIDSIVTEDHNDKIGKIDTVRLNKLIEKDTAKYNALLAEKEATKKSIRALNEEISNLYRQGSGRGK